MYIYILETTRSLRERFVSFLDPPLVIGHLLQVLKESFLGYVSEFLGGLGVLTGPLDHGKSFGEAWGALG